MTFKAPPRGFETGEYRARTGRAQAMMAAAAVSGLLLTTEAEIRYFSGFHTLFWQSPTRPWFLFVPVEGDPVAVIPEIGATLMRSTWVQDIRTWSAPAPEDDGIGLLTELLAPLAAEKAVLGVPKGPETTLRMPLRDWERLCAGLPGLRIADATQITRRLRMTKSPAEIEKLRHVCAIGSQSFARLPEIAAEGLPLEDVFRAFRREALAQGADDIPYLVGGAGQDGYRDVISPPSRQPLTRGDVLMLDTGCVWDGYFCDFDRNFAIGEAGADADRAYRILWEATEAGLECARPGVTCRELQNAMATILREAGAGDGDIGRMGHGLGMQLTEPPSLAGFDDTVIEAGMVVTLEPALGYRDGLTMVHEENILVTESGAELLSVRAPDLLPRIG